jgi:hypothetical protein
MRSPYNQRMRRWVVIVLAVLAAAAAAEAQFGGRGPRYATDPDYDGRFTFVRLRWGGRGFGRGFGDAWNHDYPRAEQHLALLLKDITYIDARTDGSLILTLDDPRLFKYPIAYMWEPGFWVLTDEEALRFREYLEKGGFAIFDDFEGAQWNNYEQQMRRVLPNGRFVKLEASHPVFDSFFRMDTIEFPHPMYGILPTYYGIFEDNDPSKRLMVIANHDHDVAEYWEFSGEGLFPVDTSNEAYKLGINYMIYGMTR